MALSEIVIRPYLFVVFTAIILYYTNKGIFASVYLYINIRIQTEN